MKTNFLRALSEKSFVYLLASEIFTQIAVNIFNFFLILVVFERTHSSTAVSGIVLSFTIPAIIFGSFAGVFVDRWDKKKVLIVSNILQIFLLICLAFSLKYIVVIYIVSFLFAILRQFFIPAETPLIPLIVSNTHLLAANALFGIGIYASILLAYVLSGPFLLVLGPVNTLFVLVGMQIVSTIFISVITLKKKQLFAKSTAEAPKILQDIRHTLSIIKRIKEISHSLFLLALSQILILLIATIAPGYAHQILGINVENFPLLFVTPAALGTIVGGLIVVHFFHSHPKQRVITIGIILSGISLLAMPYGSKVASHDFIHIMNAYLPTFLQIDIIHIMIVVAFLLGIANAFVFVPANTLIQEKTTDEFRGRIYGFLNTLVGALSLLPIIVAGGLSDLIGVKWVLIGIGLSLLVFGGFRVRGKKE